MTDTYAELYERILSEHGIDGQIDYELDELPNDELDELPNDELDELPNDNIARHERIEPEIRIILIPTENSLPKITDESIKLADYFKLRSNEVHHGDILYKIQNDGLEQPRLDLSKIISRWFPEINAQWISLKCIGASNYCVSSLGDVCHIHMRRLLKSGNSDYAVASIKFDNKIRLSIQVHNLVASAFWNFPSMSRMTVDHRNRLMRDNSKDNLSWEIWITQMLNRRDFVCKRIRINQIDPVDAKIIKEWNSANDVSEYFKVTCTTVRTAILKQRQFKGSLWKYHEPFLEEEKFLPIPIEGLDGYYVSNKGRCLLRNGRITSGSLRISGYRTINLIHKLTGIKSYYVHVLIALVWVYQNCPTRNIVNHKDHVRDNNCIENLEWVTISENGKHANLARRRVIYTDENGQQHEFGSIAEASKITKISGNTITKECKNSKLGRQTKFSYVDKHSTRGPGGKFIPVVQCDLLTNEPLFIWESITSAELYTGIEKNTISDALRGNYTFAGGFFWRYPNIFESPQDITKIRDISLLRYRGTNRTIVSVVEIYELDNDVFHNTYKSISEAARTLGIPYCTIREIVKLYRNGYNRGDGIIRWFLYQDEYERRIKNNEPLIKPIDLHNDANEPIVVLSLDGNFVNEYASAKEAHIFVKANNKNITTGPSAIIKTAKGYGHSSSGYRFAFAKDYYRNPNSYKENLPASVIKIIKNLRN
jgi:hypothetical protein